MSKPSTRFGIVQVCPAGDKERDVRGRQWDQRVEVMRDSMIYFRNNPSILFWEAGNTVVTPDRCSRWSTCANSGSRRRTRHGRRGNDDVAANAALTPIAEYYGVMIGQDPEPTRSPDPTDMFRAYSAERRDRAPLIETEDFRDEGARRFWDDYSPPYFRFKKGPERHVAANSDYVFTPRAFALAGVRPLLGLLE